MAQYNKITGELLADSKTLYEVIMLADKDGKPTDYNNGIFVEFSGSSADSFGRGRVSLPFTVGENKHVYGEVDEFLTVAANGGAVTHEANRANAKLSTTTLANSSVIHQTKRYNHYYPGKSQAIFISYNFNGVNNSSKKRVGYYDDDNGVFFEQAVDSNGVSTLKFVIRSHNNGSTTNVEVAQENWNIDACNGSNSDFIIDPTKISVVFFDFQWLGAGRVRCGFFHDGQLIMAHQFLNGNILDYVYWSNPALPVRGEVLNTAVNTGANMQLICSTVLSEGGYSDAGVDVEVQNSATRATPTPGGTWFPVLAVRLKNSVNGYKNRSIIKSENVSVYADVKSTAYKIGKVSSASQLSGTLTWTSVSDTSMCEYCENATGISNFANFIGFGGGFVTAGTAIGSSNASQATDITEAKKNIIVQNYDSTDSEVLVLMVRTIPTGVNDTASVMGSIQWKELI